MLMLMISDIMLISLSRDKNEGKNPCWDPRLQLLLGSVLQTKANHSEGHKGLGGNRIMTGDLNEPKGYSIPCNIKRKEFWRGGVYLSLFCCLGGELGVGWGMEDNCLCNTCYMHLYIYMCNHNYFPFLCLTK